MSVTFETISNVVQNQRSFFRSGKTLDIESRISSLKKLKKAIQTHEKAITEALKKDLSKPEFETYATEIGSVHEEINYALKKIQKWAKPRSVGTPIFYFPARSRIYAEPYGVVLIVGPWNYPFQLLMSPLIGALAAGNTVILKPSEIAKHTSAAVKKMIDESFPSELISAIEGDRSVNEKLLENRFDYIFFTGGPAVGRVVMESAAKYLTPVTLELGGKSPCIIDETASIELSVRRIVWGKFLNAGQTCVAPDYLLIHKDIKNEFLAAMAKEIRTAFGEDPSQSIDYARIINERHFDRLRNLLSEGNIIIGGQSDPAARYIAPTVIDNVDEKSELMKEEIFGPILPVLEYTNIDKAIDFVSARPHPLSLYFFSNNQENQQKVISKLRFGGGCINDTIVHLGNPCLPFGGVGESGMGAYHGKFSFDTFTHYKGIMHKANFLDMRFRYRPYGKNLGLLRKLMK